MRLIDAEAPKIPSYFDDPATAAFLDGLQHQPTIDAVPVVRCRDCKYRTQETRWTRAGFCGRREAGNFFVAKPDGFCSYGERKEGTDHG